MKKFQKIKKIIIHIFTLYVLLGLGLFLVQKKIIYHPNRQDFEKCLGFKDYEKKTFNSTRFYEKEISKDALIVFYHGNAGSACDRSGLKYLFEQFAPSIIFVEYTGYANDKTSPSEKRIKKDVENINQYINGKSFQKIIVIGESIGTSPASFHAKIEKKVTQIILISPFSKMQDLAQEKFPFWPTKLILTETHDNEENLKNFKGEVLFLQGEKDKIINPKFSKKLFDSIKNAKKEWVLIEKRGHNDLYDSKTLNETIKKFLEKNIDTK